jgi:hypothetical protein
LRWSSERGGGERVALSTRRTESGELPRNPRAAAPLPVMSSAAFSNRQISRTSLRRARTTRPPFPRRGPSVSQARGSPGSAREDAYSGLFLRYGVSAHGATSMAHAAVLTCRGSRRSSRTTQRCATGCKMFGSPKAQKRLELATIRWDAPTPASVTWETAGLPLQTTVDGPRLRACLNVRDERAAVASWRIRDRCTGASPALSRGRFRRGRPLPRRNRRRGRGRYLA